MDITLHDQEGNELLVNYDEQSVGFVAMIGEKQHDFVIDEQEWDDLKDFIDKQIRRAERERIDKKKTEKGPY